jgi:tRNA(fMet)-specific endonuclease VapC
MPYLLYTNVFIHLRDGDSTVSEKIADLDGAVLMSVVSRVDLDGGVDREPRTYAFGVIG